MKSPFIQPSENAPVPSVVNAAMACAISKQPFPAGIPVDALDAIISISNESVRQHVLISFLTALTVHPPEPSEIARMVEALAKFEELPPLDKMLKNQDDIDFLVVRGSGKKLIKTLNVSTPSSILATSAGSNILKMGSRGTSSNPGSADLVSGLNMDNKMSIEKCMRVLRHTGWGHYNTENSFLKLCRVYKDYFYFPHVLMFGWPRITPIVGKSLLYGISHPDVDCCAEVARLLGVRSTYIVSTKVNGFQDLDEALPFGKIRIRKIDENGEIQKIDFDAIDLVEEKVEIEEVLQPGSVSKTVSTVLDTLAGKGTRSHQLLYSLNAGLMLWADGKTKSLKDGLNLAMHEIESGAAIHKINHIKNEMA